MLSEIDNEIIKLLDSGSSLNDMLKKTNLYHSQLSQRLKRLRNNGYLIKRELVQNGLKYSLNKNNNINNDVEISIPNGYFKFLVISDTHICNVKERLDLLNKLYIYALNRKIHHVFHLGDLIDSAYKHDSDKIIQKTTHDQIKYLIKKYPKIESIVTTILLGNHDYKSISEEGIDISSVIESKRLDMKILGYKTSMIKLNNRYIALSHPFNFNNKPMQIPQDILNEYPNINPDITLVGHLHESGIYQNGNNIIVNIPSFSGNTPVISGFECMLSSKNNNKIFDTFKIKALVLEPIVFPVTEIKYDLPKTLEKKLTQIEKFNQKYKR